MSDAPSQAPETQAKTDTGGGPHVVTAVFCERVLVETDSVPTLVRVVDKHTETLRRVEGLPETVPLTPELIFYIGIRPERAGKHSLEFRLVYDGEATPLYPPHRQPVEFASAERGMNLKINLAATYPRPGKVWAEVYIDGTLRTRSPLTLSQVFEEAATETPAR